MPILVAPYHPARLAVELYHPSLPGTPPSVLDCPRRKEVRCSLRNPEAARSFLACEAHGKSEDITESLPSGSQRNCCRQTLRQRRRPLLKQTVSRKPKRNLEARLKWKG